MKSKASIVRKAVFPVAGMGTRFLPATKASPKEMIIVVDKPLIQYAVEEAYAAGIRQMVFVTSYNKNVIEDHFDSNYPYEADLFSKQKHDLLALVRAVTPTDMQCFFVRQPKALGLGHAVLCAQPLVDNEPFAVLLPDDLMVDNIPIMKQMVEQFHDVRQSIIAAEEVLPALTKQYGIIKSAPVNASISKVAHVVEKPNPEDAPSNLAIVGRYIFTPTIFNHLRQIKRKKNEELQLTDAIRGLLAEEQVFAYHFSGKRYDCGRVLGFLQANVDLGMNLGAEGEAFLQWLQEHQVIAKKG